MYDLEDLRQELERLFLCSLLAHTDLCHCDLEKSITNQLTCLKIINHIILQIYFCGLLTK